MAPAGGCDFHSPDGEPDERPTLEGTGAARAMNSPTVRGSKGPVQLRQLLGKGDEGAVYEIVGQPSLVAKVYLKDIPSERVKKLRAMSQLLTP